MEGLIFSQNQLLTGLYRYQKVFLSLLCHPSQNPPSREQQLLILN